MRDRFFEAAEMPDTTPKPLPVAPQPNISVPKRQDLAPQAQTKLEELHSQLPEYAKEEFSNRIKSGSPVDVNYNKMEPLPPTPIEGVPEHTISKSKLESFARNKQDFFSNYGFAPKKISNAYTDKGNAIHSLVDGWAKSGPDKREYEASHGAEMGQHYHEMNNYKELAQHFKVLGSEVPLRGNVPGELFGESQPLPFSGVLDHVVRFNDRLNFTNPKLNQLLQGKMAIIDFKTGGLSNVDKTNPKAVQEAARHKALENKIGTTLYSFLSKQEGMKPQGLGNAPIQFDKDTLQITYNLSTGDIYVFSEPELDQIMNKTLIPYVRELMRDYKEGPSAFFRYTEIK